MPNVWSIWIKAIFCSFLYPPLLNNPSYLALYHVSWESSSSISWHNWAGTTMGLTIYFLVIFGRCFSEQYVQLNFTPIWFEGMGINLNQAGASGIVPIGMVPVELVRYFHVSFEVGSVKVGAHFSTILSLKSWMKPGILVLWRGRGELQAVKTSQKMSHCTPCIPWVGHPAFWPSWMPYFICSIVPWGMALKWQG